MKRRSALLLCLAPVLGACGESTDAPPPPATTETATYEPVVERAIADLSASLPQVAEVPEADPELLRELTQILAGAGHDARLRALPLDEVRGVGDGAIPELARIARDAELDADQRAAAIELLAAVGTRRAGNALVALCDSREERWVRSHAAWRITELPDEVDVVIPGLLLRLRSETDHEAAVYVAVALAARKNYAGVPMLVRLGAESPDESVRERALGQLAAIVATAGAPDAETLIAQWNGLAPGLPTREPSDHLRLSAWEWIRTLSGDTFQLRPVDDGRFLLSRLGPWGVEPLADALADEDAYVRLHSAQCLERMGARARPAVPQLIAALDDARAGAQAAQSLGGIGGPGAREALLALLDDPRHELRVAAARALGSLADLTVATDLRRVFTSADAPLDLRQAAAESALRLDPADRDALVFLHDCLIDPAADVGGAERALDAWLEARPAKDATVQQWREAGDQAAGPIPTAAESRARRAARHAALESELEGDGR